MTREETVERIKVMQAFVDGKQIQYKESDGKWKDVKDPMWFSVNEYRIKPKPKYRPFANAEECWQEMQKHQPFGWVKYKEGDKYTTYCNIDGNCDFELDFEEYTFADGTPFGIKGE